MGAAQNIVCHGVEWPAVMQAFNVYKSALLKGKLDDGSPEVRWYLVAVPSRVDLDRQEAEHFCRYWHDCIRNDPSRIVEVVTLVAAKDLQARHSSIKTQFAEMIRFAKLSKWSSIAARARKSAPPEMKR